MFGSEDDEESELIIGHPEPPREIQAKSGGWSASGTLTQGNTTKKVTLQVQFPRAEDYTVQFKLTPSSYSTVKSAEVEAEIVWSVEGNSVTRRVSVTNGLSVTGTGQAVRVTIYDVSSIVDSTNSYIASVQVAPGARATTENPPQLHEDITYIDGQANASFNVPANAGISAVAVLVSQTDPNTYGPISDQAVQVRHIANAGAVNVYDPRQVFWVPITPGTESITIYNYQIAGAEIGAKVIWGIDG